MSEKRRDNRNRILHVGESQRPDGRYAYKYKDLNGDVKFVYSWRLDKNDRLRLAKHGICPCGKRKGRFSRICSIKSFPTAETSLCWNWWRNTCL